MKHYSLLFASLSLTAGVNAAELTVQIHDVKSNQGQLVVTLYKSAEVFLKNEPSVKIAAVKGVNTVVFKALPEGEYAVGAFHDENSNGKMDANAVRLPVEDYGFSNDARGIVGPPSFAKAKFKIGDVDSKQQFRLR